MLIPFGEGAKNCYFRDVIFLVIRDSLLSNCLALKIKSTRSPFGHTLIDRTDILGADRTSNEFRALKTACNFFGMLAIDQHLFGVVEFVFIKEGISWLHRHLAQQKFHTENQKNRGRYHAHERSLWLKPAWCHPLQLLQLFQK